MSYLELGMLVCFGFAWPISIYKSFRSRTAKGKSAFFSVIVLIGYLFGILHKLLYSLDGVLFAYLLNFCMVSIDLVLYRHNRKLDLLAEKNNTGIPFQTNS